MNVVAGSPRLYHRLYTPSQVVQDVANVSQQECFVTFKAPLASVLWFQIGTPRSIKQVILVSFANSMATGGGAARLPFFLSMGSRDM